MKISADTQSVIDFLQMISDNGIRKSIDLATILEVGATYSQDELVQSIIFTGKSIWNLSKILTRSPDSAAIDKINREFRDNIDEMQNQLRKITDFVEMADVQRFNIVYLQKDLGSMRNIIDLAHDLSILKDAQKKNM
ncbi:MAG: hypothetical protein ABFD61_04895 [Chloroherpetonaceae bacterium]|nr:hypothetical protein [bacterium]